MKPPLPLSKRGLRLALGACALAAASLSGAEADAQSVQQLTRAPAFGRNPVSVSDSSALLINPANTAFMTGSELRWSGVFLDESAPITWQGHALSWAFPFWAFGTGLRVDLLDPTQQAEDRFFFGRDTNHQWFTWGLGLKASESTALGFSLQRTNSRSSLAQGLASWSFGYTWRPYNEFGAAFVARDINGPRNSVGTELAPSYELALALRPTGTRAVELGLTGTLVNDHTETYVAKGTVGVDISPIGQLRGEFSVADPLEDHGARSYSAGLTLAFLLNGPGGSAELAATGLLSDQYGNAEVRPWSNLQAEVAVRGFREPTGTEAPSYALRVRIEETPGVRGHIALLRKLWAIADHEPSIKAVVFELRSSPASGLARVQELRDAVYHLRSRGKRTLCHLEDASGSALYLCSATDRTLINPAGGVRFAGLRSQYTFYKGLLDQLGVRADFVRIGPHKAAPEVLSQTGSSPEARQDHIELLQQFEAGFAGPISREREIPLSELRERFRRGPFIATEAKQAGLVDGYAFDDQLGEEARKLSGLSGLELLDDQRAPRAPEYFSGKKKLAIVYVDGDMVDGRSSTIPLVGAKLTGSYTIAEVLERLRKDPGIGAVVLRLESGGGSAMAADVIWREVKLLAAEKPVVASMGTAAASAAYYIAAPATRIFANPLTLTGSIGVFYGKVDILGLLGKLDLNVETYKTGPRADAESIYRPFTKAERSELQRKVEQFYQVFINRVAEGRKLTPEQVDQVGRGRVWTGRQALKHKLVDELGGLRQAIDYARHAGGIDTDSAIVEFPEPDSLLALIQDLAGARANASPALPSALSKLLQDLGPLAYYDWDKPLARMELVEIQP